MDIQRLTCFQASPRHLSVSVLLTLTILSACAPAPYNPPSSPEEVPRISKEELLQKIESGADILIVDMRSEAEYLSGHIKGAFFIPFSTIVMEEWQPHDNKEIILYCS
ncbi:rhodanese-like domain-containing protein [Chloroflexota bacterium]